MKRAFRKSVFNGLVIGLTAGAFSAGAFVLVPSISEFFQAREMAKEDRERAVLAEKTMVENARVLEFTLNDPQKDEKLLEQYGLENRKSEE